MVIVIALDHPPELNCRNLLLKTAHGQQDGEMKLEMSWKLLPCSSLAQLEGGVYAAVGWRQCHQQLYPGVDLYATIPTC